MAFAESSNVLLYVGQTITSGVEPTTYETWTPTGFTLQGNQGTFQDQSIDPSGKGLDQFRHSLAGGGDINYHWRPTVYDIAVEAALRGQFGSAFNETLTISFAAPSSGLQTLTDDGATGVLGGLSNGDTILIAGAVADSENAGLRRVVSSTTDTVTVYNPGGVVSAGDAGVEIDHNGVATFGTTFLELWVERLSSGGGNLIYSEWYKNCKASAWSMNFPASDATQCSFGLQGDNPVIVSADGSPPITKQRGGSDNAASSARLVHGMDDMRELVLYSPTAGTVVLHDLVNAFTFNVNRNVRQDTAVGTSSIINTAVSRPTVQGTLNAFLNDATDGTADLVALRNSNPDDLTLHAIFGANTTDSYGVYFSTVRINAAPVPVPGNDQPELINAAFSATDVRVTRL